MNLHQLGVIAGGLLVGLPLLGAASYLAGPVLKLIAPAIPDVATVLAEIFGSAARELGRAQEHLNRMIAASYEAIATSEQPDGTRNGLWDAVLRPLWVFTLFLFLMFVDAFNAVLGFEPLVGVRVSPKWNDWVAPSLGILWAAIAAAFGQALMDVWHVPARRPYAALGRRALNAVRVAVVVGVLMALLSGVLFFVWRLGQLETHSSVDSLRWPIVALMGLLLQGGVLICGWAVPAVLAMVVLVILVLVYAPVVLVQAACAGAAEAMKLTARLTERLFQIPIVLAERILELLGRIGQGAAHAAGSIAAPAGRGMKSAARSSQGGGSRAVASVWTAFVSAVRGVWFAFLRLVVGIFQAAATILGRIGMAFAAAGRGIGRAISAGGRGIGRGVAACVGGFGHGVAATWRGIGRGIAVSAIAIAHGIRVVVIALAKATAICTLTIARAISFSVVSVAKAFAAAVRAVWNFGTRLITAPFRALRIVVVVYWNWVTRFEIARKMHFNPIGAKVVMHGSPGSDPPPSAPLIAPLEPRV